MQRRPSAVQAEIHQMKPFGSVAQEALLSILRTASAVRRTIAHVIEPEGISIAQYNVLRILRGAGAEGLPTLAIRDRLIEEAPGITRLIDKLEGSGLVRRDRTRADRRQVFCRITRAGLALLARLDPRVDQAERAVAGTLDDCALEQLIASLDAIRARQRECDPEPASGDG